MGLLMAGTLATIALVDKKVHRGFFAALTAVWLMHNFTQ